MTCHPLEVDIYRLDPVALENWQSPKSPAYKGVHGMRAPNIDWSVIKQDI